MTKSILNRRVQLAFACAVLTLAAVGALSYHGMAVSANSDRWVRHTDAVLESLERLLSTARNVDSSYRGFALTGEESYADAYHASVANVQLQIAVVRDLTVDNPVQQKQIPILESISAQSSQYADTIISLRRTKGLQAAADYLRNAQASQQYMNQLIVVLHQMKTEELGLLALREADAHRRVVQTKIFLIIGTLLGLLVAAAAGLSARHAISRRALADETLRASEEQFRRLFEEVQDYAIFMLDPQGIVVSWNAGAERIKGYKASEIIGHSFSCFFTPEDIARGRPEEVLRMTAESGRHEEQGMRVRKDGSRFVASVTFIALRDADGNLRGFFKISRDISETKESAEKYRGLLEAAPDAMVVVNQSREIVLLNVQAEKQFGYRRDELLGQQVTNIIPEGFAERLIADDLRSAADALAQQIGTGIELTARRKDGSEFPIELMLSPLENAEGILVTAAIRDISVRKAAERHLAQMEGRYRGLLEAAPDAMVVVNQRGEIVLLNVRAERQFGYRRDELLGQQVKNIIPEGFAERLIADDLRSAADALAQQIGTGIELMGRRKFGSEFPIEIMLSPLESAEGILVTAAIRDISVRKAAEEHLAQMEGRYRGLLEAAPDAMVVVNQSGEIVLLNVQAEKQFGYRRDELLGQMVKNIIPEGFAERLVADALRSTEDALAQQIGTGIELTALRKDGSEFPIEIMLSPLDSIEGILVTAAIRDISVRKAAEKHLAQTSRELSVKLQLLDSVFEGTTDFIYVRDLEHHFALANSATAKLFGRSVKELLGRSMRELLPKSSFDAVAQSDQEVVRTGATCTVDEVAEIEGIQRHFLTTKSPYRDAEQRTIGTIGISREITERKRSEDRLAKTMAELKRSNDELQQFAYVASHDLQEPLRMVASYTQLLAKRYKGQLDSDADEFISYAVDGSNRMQRMIQDLLAYSRAGTNGSALRKISSDDSLNAAIANLRGAVEDSGAIVTHDPLPAITTNDTQLTQVFQNLVGNAIKYRGARVPNVHVSAARNGGGEWIFSVRDNGLGIDSQYFEKIFVLFQRLHGREEFKGTGIGLTICKKIVERLGGRIWVESRPGIGSTFYFALPEGDRS
jgi:PAS domain S-box-containing protein